MKRRISYLSSMFLFVTIAAALFYFNHDRETEITATEVPAVDTVAEVERTEFGLPLDSFEVIKEKVRPNEFLANILLEFSIPYAKIDELARQSKGIFDVRKIAAGKYYTILAKQDEAGNRKRAHYFVYQPNAIDYIVYDLRDSIKIYKGRKEVDIAVKTAYGTINSSLYVSLQESNSNPYLAIELSEIFAWSIDFYRIQKGDWFKLIYEEKSIDGEPIGIGRVLATEFNHFGHSFQAYYFEQDSGRADYFDEEANSLRKAFLKSPLKFSRLSSRYTMRRFHPVQKRWKAHLGTDYAAPKGTPIMSTGDGVVIESRYKRNNGNYVKVKHNSVYTTQYLHMSKRKVKVGDRVKQGDIIGLVGSTGLATGPHVCYRFWKNGKQVDHLKQKFPSAKPIKAELKDQFLEKMKWYQEQLDEMEFGQKSAV